MKLIYSAGFAASSLSVTLAFSCSAWVVASRFTPVLFFGRGRYVLSTASTIHILALLNQKQSKVMLMQSDFMACKMIRTVSNNGLNSEANLMGRQLCSLVVLEKTVPSL